MTIRNLVCIHGHFYQPPRESPFTGLIDEPSAAPHPNWNAKITDECYRPNTAAPVLTGNGRVARRVNNYEWMSFDFGPSLLRWLEGNETATYGAIIDSDRRSRERFSGHGSALAHPFDHVILPLATSRDKRTQVRWGIADFEHRFGRSPEGMWLPEAAVDLESLETLVDHGIRFTVLSPYQAASVRDPTGNWLDVVGGTVDVRQPYRVELPGGKSIAVFFYDGALSKDIAFDGLLNDGRILAKRLTQALGESSDGPLLAHVATDGETYGHHHKHGEMALAKAIDELQSDESVAITNYGEFLSLRPPTRVARIIEGSSWSCAHGIDRWRADCGCRTGPNNDWSQAWRGPLREALDLVRDRAAELFEQTGKTLFDDPWAARDAYVGVFLGNAPGDLLEALAHPRLTNRERTRALDLLRAQRHALAMYTSCGWFFEDISGLESILVLRHAGKLIDLTRSTLGVDLEPDFLDVLETASSNQGQKTGRDIYLEEIAPSLVRFGDR